MAQVERRGVVQRIVRVMVTLVYRDVDVGPWDPALAHGPVLAVSNHFGGLADGVLVIDSAPRLPRIMARDVIWKVPVLGGLASAIGMLPVHRPEDGARSANDQMFATAYRVLGENQMVLIFPEGVTQDVPYMAQVRTGAARIALGARQSGVRGLRILPLGVHYEFKAGFRSRVLVNPGEAIDLDAWVAARPEGVHGGADDHAAVRDLTAQLDHALRSVAPNFPDWETVAAMHQAAEVLLDDVEPMPESEMRYGDLELLAARLNRAPEPGRSGLVARSNDYRSALRAARTSDRAVARTESKPVRSWHWLRELLLLVVLLPFALAGLLFAAIPLLLVVIVSRLHIAPAVRATLLPVVALLVFAGEWLWLGIGVGINAGWLLGLAMLLLFPIYVGALLVAVEQAQQLLRRWRSRRRPRKAERSRLQEARDEVAHQAWGVL